MDNFIKVFNSYFFILTIQYCMEISSTLFISHYQTNPMV